MTRAQAQSAQIEQTRRALVVEHGEEAVARIDAEINHWIGAETAPLALLGWLWSPVHKDGRTYEYGKIRIKQHFEKESK